MARDRGVIFTDLWADEDWRKLSLGAQWLYEYLLTCASLNSCGVADWRPPRITGMNSTVDAGMIRDFAGELIGAFFVVADDETEEILIRSFFRHDGILQKPNMMVKAAREYAGISSALIRGVVAHELQRLHVEFPEGIGKSNVWVSVPQLNTILKATPMDAKNPLSNPSIKGSEMGSTPTSTSTTTTTSTRKSVQDKPALASEFASFWTLYPRKQGKADALKAFTAARKKTPAKTIIDGAQAYALLNIGEDKSFLKLPGGWIRGERWEDEQIVNATKHTTTEQPAECPFHPGYPLPCVACRRDQLEGRAF